MDLTEFPYVPLELVEHLEKIVPDCVPRLDDTEREIFHNVGAVHVVAILRMQYEAQNQIEQTEH